MLTVRTLVKNVPFEMYMNIYIPLLIPLSVSVCGAGCVWGD